MTNRHEPERLSRLRSLVSGFGFGADYNPEQWPRETWDEDVMLMKDCGVTLVTLGIFAWAQVEPRPGEFTYGWLDEVMDRLADAGIAVSLATMTASPPPWLAARHPETLPVTEGGVRLSPGGRQHYCPSSPVYREHVARLVEQVASRYGDHPALALWHIGNEFGVQVPRCFCDVSAEAFRRWLVSRYGDVDGLNQAWSTAFWSQQYSDWSEVVPPRLVPAIPNPAQVIDFRRFSSDELLACYRLEREICLRVAPEVPVTTNLLSVPEPLDGFAWAEQQDVVSHDSYPDPFDPAGHVLAAYTYDLMRSLKRGQPWLLLEQAPSAVNWRAVNGPKPPGVMRLGSYQAIARGADALLYFQWRQSRGGAEKFHSAVVPHGGTDSRIYQEVRHLGAELAGLGEIVGSRVQTDVALVLDWSSWWALEQRSHPSAGVTQRDANLSHYRPLWEAGCTADVVAPMADLSRYRLVVVPNLYLVTAEAADNLAQFVAAGGMLLLSFFSGIVDECDRVHLGGYPAPFRELLGLRVDEFWPLPDGGQVGLAFADGSTGRGSVWSEMIIRDGAATVATFTDGPLRSRPAITRHAFGDGEAWYLGTRPDPEAMRRLISAVLDEAGITPAVPDLPRGVEAVIRHGIDARYLFLLNHTDQAVDTPRPTAVTVLLGDETTRDRLTLPPRDLAILRLSPSSPME